MEDVGGEEVFERHIKRRVPQRRMIEAEEIAGAAVFWPCRNPAASPARGSTWTAGSSCRRIGRRHS